LQNLDSLCTEQDFDGGVIWCYSERTAVPEQQLALLRNNIRINEGVPDNFDNTQGKPCLIILDDLLIDVYSKEVCSLFTRGSHHRNISVILITQNVFHQGRYCRDKNQFLFLARQVYPEDSNSVYRAYLDATEKAYGYLMLDLSQDIKDKFRFRTRIFPTEYPPAFYVHIRDEKVKVELSYSTSTQNSSAETT